MISNLVVCVQTPELSFQPLKAVCHLGGVMASPVVEKLTLYSNT